MGKKEIVKDEEAKENIFDLMNSVTGNKPNNVTSDDTLKNLELAKIIVKEMLDGKNIKSLSNINKNQVNDIVNALLLNTYYQIPEINEYVFNFLTLKRSQEGLLLKTFEKIVMNRDAIGNEHSGFFDRILKR